MANGIMKGLNHILTNNRFDLLHAIQPISGLACAPLARRFGIPLITDLHNIWPEEMVAQGLIERDDETFIFLKNIEQTIIDSSDVITVVSHFMKEYVKKNYSVRTKQIVVVPSAGPIVNLNPKTLRRDQVVYAGMVNLREHVDLFAHSIQLTKQYASFFISNHGDAIDEVKRITRQIAGKDINYLWFKKRSEVLDFLKQSKIGILTSKNDITRQIGPPLKLYDYMACGLPVVANNIDGWSRIIDDENIGLTTRDDPAEFASAVDKILNDESLWLSMHENAVRAIQTKYNWEITVQNTLLPVYNKL